MSAPVPSETVAAAPVPEVSGGLPLLGHLLQLRRNPIDLMQRVHDECGEIGEMRWAGQDVVMLYGEEAQEAFFRAPDEQLDQPAAYPFMTPVFGPGVVFDATPEQRKQAIRNQSLRDDFMRGHAEVIAAETRQMIERLRARGEGEIDLLDFFAELTLYTSSACLIGKDFRDEIPRDWIELFYELERGTDAFAYVNPHLPLPSFRARDRARKALVAGIQGILDRREAEGRRGKDLVQILQSLRDEEGRPRYSVEQITGMFISIMFAGHHTTSGTAAWTLIELLKHPHRLKTVVDELDTLYAGGAEVSYQALREIPELECALKESLRLHPPLIILMRKVMHDFHYKGHVVPAGKLVAVSPAISNRMPEHFPEPERFDPDRYKPGRAEDKKAFAWIPFGGGRHRCVGAAFAMMQLKAIFSVLLRELEFELAQPPESYRNDHSKMVVQLRQPCRARFRVRQREAPRPRSEATRDERVEARQARVAVDADLCQGHAVCVSECPEIFEIDRDSNTVRLRRDDVPAELYAAAGRAVRYCPTQALRLTAGPETQGRGEES